MHKHSSALSNEKIHGFIEKHSCRACLNHLAGMSLQHMVAYPSNICDSDLSANWHQQGHSPLPPGSIHLKQLMPRTNMLYSLLAAANPGLHKNSRTQSCTAEVAIRHAHLRSASCDWEHDQNGQIKIPMDLAFQYIHACQLTTRQKALLRLIPSLLGLPSPPLT